MQDNVTQAEIIVARHIDAWGWGPLDRIEGLAEHKLAVDACAAGLASTTAQTEAVQKLVEAAEDNAWREARELVRGTNADLCKTGEQAYRIIQKGITDAVNNRNLRTLKGRVAAHRESQP